MCRVVIIDESRFTSAKFLDGSGLLGTIEKMIAEMFDLEIIGTWGKSQFDKFYYEFLALDVDEANVAGKVLPILLKVRQEGPICVWRIMPEAELMKDSDKFKIYMRMHAVGWEQMNDLVTKNQSRA